MSILRKCRPPAWLCCSMLSVVCNVALARPFTATDLVTLREIGRVTLAPNGRWLVWDQHQTDLASNRARKQLWLLDLQRSHEPPRRLSPLDDPNAHNPSFAADGEWIYFLSDASGLEQLWRVPTRGGAAQQVSDFDVALSGYSLSPTGGQVAIWADTSTACNELPCHLPQPVESCCGTGRSFEDAYVQRGDAWRLHQARSMIYVPHWNAWMMPEVRSRVYVMSVSGGKATSAMDRSLGDTPAKPFSGAGQIAWSADGRSLFFTLREAGRAERFSFNLDVIEARVDASNSANLTRSNQGVDALPAASPDGKWLAYVSARSANDAAATTLQLRNIITEEVTPIGKDWDGSVRSIAWEADSRGLLVTARIGMDEPLFRVSLDHGKVTRLTGEGRVANVVPGPKGGAVLTLETMTMPAELYRMLADGELQRLTAINDDQLRDLDIPRVQRFDFKGAKGASMNGWMIAPDATRESLPMVVLIHDGMHGEPANGWSRRWHPALFSAPGYAVVGIDFRGTAGYGAAFAEDPRIERDTLALEDLRLGLAAAARRFSRLDAENVCIAGDGAYGGYLVYRIAGQWSRQPRCLIANGGVVDATAMSYQTDEPWIHDWHRASADAERSGSDGQWNPLRLARSWRTPVLMLHGERNFRVPYTQSVAAFTAAQRHDVPSRLVVFPDEGVWVQAPKNTIQWYGEVFNWLDRWWSARRVPAPADAIVSEIGRSP